MITSLFEIHQQAWLEFCSTNMRTSSTNKIAFPQKKTFLSLVAQYYQISGNLRKLQRHWFARPINSFTSWRVDELRYWIRTANRILTNNKLSPSSKLKELKYHTVLYNNNRNTDDTHLLHKILPLRNLQNYKNTPLSRFFSSPAVGTDQQNLFPSCNLPTKHILQNFPTDSFGILSTLTSSDEQRDSYSIPQKNHKLVAFVCTKYLNLFLSRIK